MRVHGCTVNAPWDDAIVPKSSFALGYPQVTERHYFRLQRQWQLRGPTWRVGRIKCGTESNGGVKNIAITNCVFDQCWGLALETVDGAAMEDIVVSNITMRNCYSSPLFVRLGRRMRGPK